MKRSRYIISTIAEGRTAVWDRNLQRVVTSFTPEQAFRAQGVADQLNHEHEHGDYTPQLIADMERDGLL